MDKKPGKAAKQFHNGPGTNMVLNGGMGKVNSSMRHPKTCGSRGTVHKQFTLPRNSS